MDFGTNDSWLDIDKFSKFFPSIVKHFCVESEIINHCLKPAILSDYRYTSQNSTVENSWVFKLEIINIYDSYIERHPMAYWNWKGRGLLIYISKDFSRKELGYPSENIPSLLTKTHGIKVITGNKTFFSRYWKWPTTLRSKNAERLNSSNLNYLSIWSNMRNIGIISN